MNSISSQKRLKNSAYSQLVVGDSQICALSNNSTNATIGNLPECWRNQTIIAQMPAQQPFTSLASGADFVCGLKAPNNTVQCWGTLDASRLPNATQFQSIQAGSHHACGLTPSWNLQCWGDNTYGQLQPPDGKQFLAMALGKYHSCGIDATNRSVICWGSITSVPGNLAFATIVAGDFFTCGVLNSSSSVYCWGGLFQTGRSLPLNLTLPSFCTSMNCPSGSFLQNGSGGICANSQHVCTTCRLTCEFPYVQTSTCGPQQDITCTPDAAAPSPLAGSNPSNSPAGAPQEFIRYVSRLSGGLIALIVLGSMGILSGVLTIGWWLWVKFYVGVTSNGSQGRVHNSTAIAIPSPRIKRLRSSTSSVRSRGEVTTGAAQEFTIAEMAAATMGFSEENKIATGSFGIVYKGMLPDGTEVAIKRGEREAVANEKRVEEKEAAFLSELELLSRLHHKHLVSLVGYCDEEDERMLVYEFMPNGTLHDHLHNREEGAESLSWQMRIKIALEAARGVEYLHNYAVPPIIHRDIKSSNILLDGGWNARVSDFGLSTRGPGENSHLSLMAAGTIGYMDPEYYRLQHLTIKSDVYSFGVVLLELLTGERAIHKQSDGPVNIVDFALPKILDNDLLSVLDQRPGVPEFYQLRALEIIARLASRCVQLEGKERPTMTEIVAVLEEAMAFSHNGRSRSHSTAVSTPSASEGLVISVQQT